MREKRAYTQSRLSLSDSPKTPTDPKSAAKTTDSKEAKEKEK